MKTETYQACLNIALSYKQKYGVTVTSNVFKDVMVHTLHKIGMIRNQIAEYVTTDEYIPLLFNDCLYEHYMFEAQMNKLRGGKTENDRAVV